MIRGLRITQTVNTMKNTTQKTTQPKKDSTLQLIYVNIFLVKNLVASDVCEVLLCLKAKTQHKSHNK